MGLFNKEVVTTTLNIEGMHCEGCTNRVKNALSDIQGIKEINVSLENKQAVIKSKKEIDPEMLKFIITELGFELKSIE